MGAGIYMGPSGQLVEVSRVESSGDYWDKRLSVQVSDTQGFWLEFGSMSHEINYLLMGWEFLGKL